MTPLSLEPQNGASTGGSSRGTPSTDTVLTDIQNSIKEVFSLKNIVAFIWFLILYYILYYAIKIFYKNENDPATEIKTLSRSIDVFIFSIIIIILIMSYYSLSEYDKKNLISYCLVETRNFFDNPNTFFSLILFIIVFYCFIYLCGVPMGVGNKPISIRLIEQKLWILLLMVAFIDFFRYILNIDIMHLIYGDNNELIHSWNSLKNYVPTVAPPPVAVDTSNNVVQSKAVDISNSFVKSNKNEVFNIANNLYTYEDAQQVCKAFNARLATVDEINQAYEDGAEWCVNSWSADMQVLFPTQQETYDRLQKIKGAENSCGRTGVNGGRITNKYLRFGVNCYGVKPDASDEEMRRMQNLKDIVVPKTKEDMVMQAKVDYWKKNKDKFLVVNPFNNSRWHEY